MLAPTAGLPSAVVTDSAKLCMWLRRSGRSSPVMFRLKRPAADRSAIDSAAAGRAAAHRKARTIKPMIAGRSIPSRRDADATCRRVTSWSPPRTGRPQVFPKRRADARIVLRLPRSALARACLG
jgi:hypothetical protein